MASWAIDEYLVNIRVTELTLNFVKWLSKISKITNVLKADKKKKYFIMKWNEEFSHLSRK